jgi:hypothetical protein
MSRKDLASLTIGEHWAYRARQQDPLVEVSVLRLGSKAPARVVVRWVADEFEGMQDWVPRARLKANWAGVDEFRARERRWDGVLAESEEWPEAMFSAVSLAFQLLLDENLATLGYNAENGVVKIHDVTTLSAFLELDAEGLRDASPTTFEEDGDLIAPLTTAILIARRAVEREPNRVLQYIEREEADAQREAIEGRHYPDRKGGWDVSPEICRQVDEEHGKPVRAILREWCGAGPVEVRHEIAALREEAERLQKLATSALEALRAAGHEGTANRIEREMGAPRERS